MLELSVCKDITISENKVEKVVYNLMSNEDYFDIECYVEGKQNLSEFDHCVATRFTKDKDRAYDFFERITKDELLPIHLENVVDDCFDC